MEVFNSFLPLISILAIWFALAFYFGRKVSQHKKSLVVDDKAPANCLSLSRGIEPTNYLRNYVIYINNSPAGSIASGETRHFKLEPGEHTISLKIDWCSSKAFQFSITHGKNTKLKCGANYNNWKCLFMYLVKPSNWVYVEVA